MKVISLVRGTIPGSRLIASATLVNAPPRVKRHLIGILANGFDNELRGVTFLRLNLRKATRRRGHDVRTRAEFRVGAQERVGAASAVKLGQQHGSLRRPETQRPYTRVPAAVRSLPEV